MATGERPGTDAESAARSPHVVHYVLGTSVALAVVAMTLVLAL